LHNEDEVKRKDIRIGDTVLVQKAGDIIPEVVSVVKSKRPASAKEFKMPARCPICGGAVARPAGEAAHRCVNPNCFVIQLKKLVHFVSRDAFDIEGLGEKIVEQLYKEGLVRDAADFFTLEEGDITPLERFAEKSAANLISAIQNAKEVPLDRFIYALGMPHVGSQMARELAEHFRSLDRFARSSLDDLIAIEGVGEKVAQSVHNWFKEKENRALLTKLNKVGVKIISLSVRKSIGPLAGKIFVLTGTLSSMSRPEAENKIRALGGKTSSSVSQETDYVVAGENPGSKYDKAKKLGIRILDEAEFLAVIRG
jgi:DNA ligase (NAD+)